MEENEQDSRKSTSIDVTASVGHISLKTSFFSNTSQRSASLKSDGVIASKLPPPPSEPPIMTPVKRRWKDHHKTRRRSRGRGSPGLCKENQVGKSDVEPFFNGDDSAAVAETPVLMIGKGTDGASILFPLPQSPDLIKSRSKFLLTYDSEDENECHHNTENFMQSISISPYSPYPRLIATLAHSDGDLHFNTMRTMRPIAASLEEYMEESGTMKFFPRPEWCRTADSHFQKFRGHEMHCGRRQSDSSRRIILADDANETTTIGNIPVDLDDPNPRPGDQFAPENGFLIDQSWCGPINGETNCSPLLVTDTTYIPPCFQHTTRQHNSATSIAFVEQTANHLHHSGLIEVSSTSNDEESVNISFSQRLQMISSSEDDASVLSQQRSHRYPLREENTLHQTALEESSTAFTFGKEYNTALHVCIQNNATKAAAELIQFGAPVDFSNIKGLTPIILASQKGNLHIVRILLKSGASPVAATFTGSTALIQASHYGHSSVVEFLLRHGAMAEQANYKNTTALMRAAQEGHEEIVNLLLRYNCRVNRENHEKMTALMLAAQRGHAIIAKILIRAGATIDVKTTQDSTALMLACKRGHLEIAKVLIAAGSELMLRDSRDRTARDTAIRKGLIGLLDFITPQVQISLMKYDIIIERKHVMLTMWELLQQERATVKFFAISPGCVNCRGSTTIHELAANLHGPLLKCMSSSRRALVLSMMLPMPLVGIVSSYLPAPRLWGKRLEMLTRRSHIDADCAVSCALDLIDEVLDVGGFVEACNLSGIIPPANFETWAEWKVTSKYGNASVGKTIPQIAKTDTIIEKIVDSNHNLRDFIGHECSVVTLRRDACFLQLIAHRSPLLAKTLRSPPYEIPEATIQQLINNSDIQSLVRRLGSNAGVHFEVHVATEVVSLARQLLLWYNSSHQRCCNE